MDYQCTDCGRHARFTRRHFLFGSAGAVSLGLLRTPADAQIVSANASPRRTARTCIFINLSGGPSQLDTFDPKDGPWNPREINLQQNSGGIVLSGKLFPNLSARTGDMCILRSCSSWEAAHNRGQFYLQTAHSLNPAFATSMPHVGAVVSYELGGKGPLPPFLSISALGDEQRQGFLPGRNTPFSFSASASGVASLDPNYFGSQSQQIFNDSYSLLQTLDQPLQQNPLSAAMAAYGPLLGQASSMVFNTAVDRAFQFSADDDRRYGSTTLGRGLLTARNLVQSRQGACFISVTHYGWDFHIQQFDAGNAQNLYLMAGDLDRSLGNLIDDLKASGDFDSTLIVALGEFGRTPGALNVSGGRDHYAAVMSTLLAGGGIRGGRAIGSTDSTGSTIMDPGWSRQRPIFTEDIVATIYSALGIDWTKVIENTPMGRAYYYIQGDFGPIDEVFG